MPTDDIALLNQLRKDGEITEEQYEALRRHVLWGTPLPAHLEAELGESNPVLEAVAEPAAESAESELPESLDLPEPVRPPAPGPATPRKFSPTLPSARPGPAGEPPSQTPPPPTFSPQLRGRPPQGPRTGPPPGQPVRPNQPPRTQPTQHQPVQQNQSVQRSQPGRPAGPPPQRPPAQNGPQPRYGPPLQSRPQAPNRPLQHNPPPNSGQRPPNTVPPNTVQPNTAQSTTARPTNLRVPLLAGGIAVVVLLAVLGTWFFGFRGDGSMTPAKYASAVCPDLASWKGDIGKSAGAMTAAVNSASDPRGKQRAAQNYFHAAGTRTDQLVTALSGDGTPKAGKAFADQLQSAARTASAAFKSSAQQTGELETSASSFASGLQVIIHDPQQPVSQLQTVLAKAPGDLGSALKNNSDCGSLSQPAP